MWWVHISNFKVYEDKKINAHMLRLESGNLYKEQDNYQEDSTNNISKCTLCVVV